MTCFFTCAATSARKWQLSQWVPNRSLLCTVKNKATKPTLTQRRSSRYKNVGVKVCWRIWACVVHLITSVLCCWTDLSQNRGFFFVCFERINVFFCGRNDCHPAKTVLSDVWNYNCGSVCGLWRCLKCPYLLSNSTSAQCWSWLDNHPISIVMSSFRTGNTPRRYRRLYEYRVPYFHLTFLSLSSLPNNNHFSFGRAVVVPTVIM